MATIFYDSETCGLHGFVVLIQWAEDDGPVNLHHVWLRPVKETLALIEKIINAEESVGFNLTFDHFHLCKCYTVFKQLDPDLIPYYNVKTIVAAEEGGKLGPCLKPRNPLDLMLYSRKGPYQSLMDRKDIRIRKVPDILAENLADYLDKSIKIDDIYFARRKERGRQWRVYPNKDAGFSDVVLKFQAGGSLKILAQFVLGKDSVIKFDEVGVGVYPYELGYAPTVKAVKGLAQAKGKPTWDEIVINHVDHWRKPLPQQYAIDDVINTRDLYNHFKGLNDSRFPKFEAGDDDSVLACSVAACRWKGFSVDIEGLKERRKRMMVIADSADTKPASVMAALKKVLKPEESWMLISQTGANLGKESTSRLVLEEFEKMNGHPVQDVAKIILTCRRAKMEINLINKLIRAGRLHPDFSVIGTLSSRMSGSGGLNMMAIKREKAFRKLFTFADPGYKFGIGDFDSFEVAIAEAVYNDPKLRQFLLSGRKLHAAFGSLLYKPMTYEEILADLQKYTDSKSGVFALLYAGDWNTLVKKLKVEEEQAKFAFEEFGRMFPGIGQERQKTINDFCSMSQSGGIGTKIEWKEPKDYAESLFGFKRFFTLENTICKALYDLANKLPPEWAKLPVKVVRRDRVQTASGAVASAIYGAAFGLQGANMRAAANHRIQSTGATVTKRLQCTVWKHQPVGINDFIVQIFQNHDELGAVVKNGHEIAVKETVENSVKSYSGIIPMVGMEWKPNALSWADK